MESVHSHPRTQLQAQLQLQYLNWPAGLERHPASATMRFGDVGDGRTVMAGLRVRMGIHTGKHGCSASSNPLGGIHWNCGPVMLVRYCTLSHGQCATAGLPDGVFLHDSGMVDYRGSEYDLAGEICDMAEGGQILMSGTTFLG